MPVTLTGTNFVVGATTVTVSGSWRDGQQRHRGQQHVADRHLRARSGRSSRFPDGDGHDRRRDERRANLHDQSAGAGRADADRASRRIKASGAATVAVTLTGTNFVVGATTVTVGGGGVTVTNIVVASTHVADRQLRARSGRSSWCPHGNGHDGRRNQRTRGSSRSLCRRRARRR